MVWLAPINSTMLCMTTSGQYALPGAIKTKKVGGGQRPVVINEALLNSLGGSASATAAPSIPTKFQSYGYECDRDGRLKLQDPLYPVYSGKQADAVGPCEYDPKIDVKFKSAPKASFGKVRGLTIVDATLCVRP